MEDESLLEKDSQTTPVNPNEIDDDREYDLIDTYPFSLDAKGRLFIPAKIREILGSTIYLMRGQNGCLMGFSQKRWKKLTSQVAMQPLSKGVNVQRQLGQFGSKLETDSQGRVTIPQKLRNAANLEKDVTIVGAITHIEIWNTEMLEAQNNEDDNFIDFLGSIGM